jgi:choline dehydrogenase-like flavoprotein
VSASRIVIVGAGMVGAALAHGLTARGHRVTVLEKGPDIPYPHSPQFERTQTYAVAGPRVSADPDLVRMTQSGDYLRDLAAERVACVGGSATAWAGLTMRMHPRDFRLRSLYGVAVDWPIGYADLEPWYGEAERFLGVSGTDDDNPYAPPRSRPYPLPPFPLAADDRWLRERLAADGIHLHTTPQARTRHDWDGRPACMNYGVCGLCPIGARYSPNHHLRLALATGRCEVVPEMSVRRVLLDASGRARGVLLRAPGTSHDLELPAEQVCVAAGALDSARLLLLSRDARFPDGAGNRSGHVGRHLVFHHVWSGHLHWDRPLFAGKVGWWTGQSQTFIDHPRRGAYGGMKIELPSSPWTGHQHDAAAAADVDQAMRHFDVLRRCRRVAIHAEPVPSDAKRVTLSEERDRFDDPMAHIHYAFDDYDRRTYDEGRRLFERVARAGGAAEWLYRPIEEFATFAHHMGTTRMAAREADGVTDSHGRVFGVPGLWTLGLGTFAGSGGAVNPALTAVALALRSVGPVAEALGPPA